MRQLELLAPARNAETARQAIIHGADAVYIGASSHGARSAAANSIDDIRALTEFAHPFRARVYVTVNTIIYDNELSHVQRLICDLYNAGVDAIIVQDMGILRLTDIPPIQLHASTQCDITTPEKARFLQDVGFSQLVLARELSLTEIKRICEAVTVPIECFVHGALCMSYSGRCHVSVASGARSANRGECAQICRLPYSLCDADGRMIVRDKYLLSMHDLNTLQVLPQLVDAGVSSFKIEGRLKDVEYVKNITALYRTQLDEIINKHPDLYCRSSYGHTNLSFTPKADKSFNRGFTTFSLLDTRNPNLISPDTPKSIGEAVTVNDLNPGDGIAWFENGGYTGSRVNTITPDKKVILSSSTHNNIITLPKKGEKTLRRTFDVKWQQLMARNTATRKIDVDISLYQNRLTISDQRGISTTISLDITPEKAHSPQQQRRQQFERLGNTVYNLRCFNDNISADIFIPNSVLATIRRDAIQARDQNARVSYPFVYRRAEDYNAKFPYTKLDYRANISNRLSKEFYKSHGVTEMEPALELNPQKSGGKTVMTSRHCILRHLGMCLRKNPGLKTPLTISNGNLKMRIVTDCQRCEMRLIKL